MPVATSAPMHERAARAATMAEGWDSDARAALSGGAGTAESIPTRRPPVLDPDGLRAFVAPILAAIAWASAVFQEMVSGSPIDPFALLLRAVALGLSIRAILSLRVLGARLRVWSRTPRYGLALAGDGLVFRAPDGDVAVKKDDIVAIRERGTWGERSTQRRFSEVFLILRPRAGCPWLPIPPVFERTSSELAEHLMRWRGTIDAPEAHEYPPPARLASKIYDDAARGTVPEGGIVIRHGRRWLTRGPYATVLLGIAIVDGFLRLGPSGWAQMGFVLPSAVGISLLLVPLVWVWLTRRAISPRKGIALVMTPAEMLMRTREGVLRATWKGLDRVRIERKRSWTILEGYHHVRTLVIERKNDQPIRYDEAFLGAPAEVVTALAEAYRRGIIPP